MVYVDHVSGRVIVFFFNDTATTEIYTLSLHDALPIYRAAQHNLEKLTVRRRRVNNHTQIRQLTSIVGEEIGRAHV